VAVAPDGLRGVELALEHAPDLALVDIGLPGLDGYQVARALRARVGQGLRLVALSGYGDPESYQQALKAGFDVHLTKPVRPADLDRVLSNL
jgi:CheY-like chemotaxis protein